nr:hypothetical protein Iba_chr11dCG3470 [Ipomoea batatas]GMD58389.1 hypothetical protein Iba_chr11fCG5080 [Ipomoea batatas]
MSSLNLGLIQNGCSVLLMYTGKRDISFSLHDRQNVQSTSAKPCPDVPSTNSNWLFHDFVQSFLALFFPFLFILSTFERALENSAQSREHEKENLATSIRPYKLPKLYYTKNLLDSPKHHTFSSNVRLSFQVSNKP